MATMPWCRCQGIMRGVEWFWLGFVEVTGLCSRFWMKNGTRKVLRQMNELAYFFLL
jgi:hypothetical protein